MGCLRRIDSISDIYRRDKFIRYGAWNPHRTFDEF